jgi:chemotaxis protein CheC
MDENNVSLSNKQLEPLTEVATIGAGNGATAISKMLNQEVKFETPQLELIKVEMAEAGIGKKDDLVTMILSKLTGDLTGVVLFIFDPQTAVQIGGILTQNPDLKKSALNEMENIFLGNALKAIARFFGLPISHSIPAQATDMLGALVDPVISTLGEKSEEVLLIKVNFSINDLKFKAVFLTNPKSTTKVIIKLNNEFTKS